MVISLRGVCTGARASDLQTYPYPGLSLTARSRINDAAGWLFYPSDKPLMSPSVQFRLRRLVPSMAGQGYLTADDLAISLSVPAASRFALMMHSSGCIAGKTDGGAMLWYT